MLQDKGTNSSNHNLHVTHANKRSDKKMIKYRFAASKYKLQDLVLRVERLTEAQIELIKNTVSSRKISSNNGNVNGIVNIRNSQLMV